MPPNRQRGSRVIYVATSARELPEEVQDWLSQGTNRAAASPNVYDALATLAAGKRPVALIVNIDSVDWNEFEFFELALRVSRDTRVFVTGPVYENAKLDAACARGAELFSAEKLDEALSLSEAPPTGAADLVAGSIAKEPEKPAASPINMEPAKEEHRPPVRLVTPSETDEEATVPVPWAPSPNRPQRTPPKPVDPPHSQEQASSGPSEFTRVQGASQFTGVRTGTSSLGPGTGTSSLNPETGTSSLGPDSAEARSRSRKPPAQVKLTAEELAALLGRPAEGDGGAAKGGGS